MNARNEIGEVADRLRDAFYAADLMLKSRQTARPPTPMPALRAPTAIPSPDRETLRAPTARRSAKLAPLAALLSRGQRPPDPPTHKPSPDRETLRAPTARRSAKLAPLAALFSRGQRPPDPPTQKPSPDRETLRAPTARRSAKLAPLAAGAAVIAVVLASVFVADGVGRPDRTGSDAGPAGGTTALPEFYLLVDSAAYGWPVEVRRTADGAVTNSEHLPGEMLLTGHGSVTADASDRAFYVARFPACTEATPVTRFYRITINDSGRITGYKAVGSPVPGVIGSLAVSPGGSQMAYTIASTGWCQNPGTAPPATVTAIHVMDLSTGAVRTWRSTVTTPGPGWVTGLTGLSWTADGRTVVAVATMAGWAAYQADINDISVLGLNATGTGGSLQANSRVLLSQDHSCVSCVQEAIAGPDGSLTAVVLQQRGKQVRQMVARIWPGTGRPPTVLYSAAAPPTADEGLTGVFADPSGQWVITWPPANKARPGWQRLRAGWIRNGALVSLPGTTLMHPDALGW